jgi:hypothetical protein
MVVPAMNALLDEEKATKIHYKTEETMKVKHVPYWTATFTVLLASTAFAAQGPCFDDVAKLCKDVDPGGGRVLACLKQNEAQVSAACKEHLREVKKKLKEAQKACHDDVEQFCSEVKPGKGAMAQCLKEHADELSPECKEKLSKMQ